MGAFIFPLDYLSLFRRKHHSTSISIRFHQCERWRKWKGKCFAESFAERLKLSLKPSTVLSTVTGELPEFHGNQTSAVSFWFRTSEKHLQKAPPQKIHTKNNKNSPPKKQLCQNYTKNKRFGQASGKIESFDIHDLCLCQQLKRIVFVWPRWECKDVIETLKHQTRHLKMSES